MKVTEQDWCFNYTHMRTHADKQINKRVHVSGVSLCRLCLHVSCVCFSVSTVCILQCMCEYSMFLECVWVCRSLFSVFVSLAGCVYVHVSRGCVCVHVSSMRVCVHVSSMCVSMCVCSHDSHGLARGPAEVSCTHPPWMQI